MPPDRARPDKLSIVVFSGDFDRVHYALAMASAAAAVNMPATLFFTMGAVRALLRGDDEATGGTNGGAGGTAGDAARADAGGRPGWHALAAAEDGTAPGAREAAFKARGVAGFEELLAACGELGVRFMVCEMGLRAMGITRAELRDDITLVEGGIVSFLADASATGQTLFI